MKTMLDNYYIYIYLDPRKFGQYCYSDICFLYEPFYIGKGKKKRLSEIKLSRSTYFKNKINKIKQSGLEPIVFKLYKNLNENLSFEFEIKLIKEIGRIDLKTGTLVNMTDGGEGSNNKVFSKETRDKISNKNKGRIISKETRLKLSQKHRGKNNGFFGNCHSQKTKHLISFKNKGKLSGEKNPSAKLIIQDVI